jgi:hypothetical protein
MEAYWVKEVAYEIFSDLFRFLLAVPFSSPSSGLSFSFSASLDNGEFRSSEASVGEVCGAL